MEARDLKSARALLHADFVMVFPGDVRMHSLEELIAWAKPRYRSVAKNYQNFDVAEAGGRWLVYAYGTLEGERLDGSRFAGIRFIDRFEICIDENGEALIIDQKVWNDLAEVEHGTKKER